jgi:hypothetical protein
LTSTLAQIAPVIGSVGSMGVAGVATGVVTGEAVQQAIDAEEATASSAPISGNITIQDPDTHQPQENFVTDENGELTIEILAPAGESSIEVSIGGETVVVDLATVLSTSTPSTPPPATPPSPEINIANPNFKIPSTQFQTTVTLTPNFGVTPTGTVSWTVLSSNITAAFWKRPSGGFYGLTWGPTADGDTAWTSNAIRGAAPTGPVAQLTDVVGNRTVVVQASTVVAGVTYTRNLTVTFGSGPLADFTGSLTPNKKWADATDTSYFVTWPPQDNGAPIVCGGSGWNDHSQVSGSLPPLFGYGWTSFSIGPETFWFTASSKLPTPEQLIYVSRHDASSNNASIPSKGAASAAGWTLAYYWTGALWFDGTSHFKGLTVNLNTGSHDWLTHFLTNSAPTAACVY